MEQKYDVVIKGPSGKRTLQDIAPGMTIGQLQKDFGLETLVGENQKPLDPTTQIKTLGQKGQVVVYELVGVVGGYEL